MLPSSSVSGQTIDTLFWIMATEPDPARCWKPQKAEGLSTLRGLGTSCCSAPEGEQHWSNLTLPLGVLSRLLRSLIPRKASHRAGCFSRSCFNYLSWTRGLFVIPFCGTLCTWGASAGYPGLCNQWLKLLFSERNCMNLIKCTLIRGGGMRL